MDLSVKLSTPESSDLHGFIGAIKRTSAYKRGAYDEITGELYKAAGLPQDAMKVVSRVVQEEGRRIAPFAVGLPDMPVDDPLGRFLVEQNQVSDNSKVSVSLDGTERTDAVTPDFKLQTFPLPIIHANVSLPERVRRAGGVANLEGIAVRNQVVGVLEEIENLCTVGGEVGGQTIFGVFSDDAPGVIEQTITANNKWDSTNAANTGKNKQTQLRNATKALRGQRKRGPYAVYMRSDIFDDLGDDYSDQYPRTVLSRLLELSGVQSIEPSDFIPADQDVIVRDTAATTMQLMNGIGTTVVPYTSPDGMTLHWKVFAVAAPAIHSTYAGRAGIVIQN